MAVRTLQSMLLSVGRKCGLLDSTNAFVDGQVSAVDVTEFLNTRKDAFYLKMVNKYPYLGEYEEPLDLADGVNFFEFNDLTEDQIYISKIGVKYHTTDTSYTTAYFKEKNVLFRVNTDVSGLDYSKPTYRYVRDDTGAYGIELNPVPTEAVTDGLLVSYIILPADLSVSTDTFSYLPALSVPVVEAYAIADVWETKHDWSNSNQALNRAMKLEDDFFSNYDPYGADKPVSFNIGKSFNPFKR